jgi:hypothetical protein
MKRGLLIVALFAFVVSAACADADNPPGVRSAGPVAKEGCDSAESDLDTEPNYAANYLHRWETAEGCPVRLDIVMTRRGKDACGGEKVADILMGTPLGRPHDDSPARIYVKDPTNVFNDHETASAYDPDATLPEDASDSGYRQDGTEMWTVPEDDRFIYLVHEDNIEQWPLDPSPPGCS